MIAILCLSIRQPWAYLIVQGYKDIENRNWYTNFRGKFLIHAPKTFDEEGYCWLFKQRQNLNISHLPSRSSFYRGGIVGKATLINCVTYLDNKWFFGPYGFVLQNAQPLPFIPMKGKQKFFEIGMQNVENNTPLDIRTIPDDEPLPSLYYKT